MSGENATITLLLTDIEGSTKLWEKDPEFMAVALARHDQLAREAIEAAGGVLVKARGEGDSLFARFSAAAQAVSAATALQRRLGQCGETKPLAVRMAIHSGDAVLRDGDYYGPTVNRCARIREIAHGGQILLSGATFALCDEHALGAFDVRDRGLLRLRDLTQPERVYEVLVPEMERDFPPLRSLEMKSHNLPMQATTFVGRAAELEIVKSQILGNPLVSVVGVGGCGKTRLALQVAADVIDSFESGAWFADLSGTEPGGVEDALFGLFGCSQSPGQDLATCLSDLVRGRGCLIVMDNCERVLDDAAWIIQSLQKEIAGLAVLVTSREPLSLKSERVMRLAPLAVPEVGETSLELVANSEAAQMFEDRAAMREPGFQIDASNVRHVASICRRLDGLPLALELAAAQIDILSPKQLDERLESALLDVRGGARGEAARHETMRAAIAWSYEGLDAEERRVFAGLATFHGGFTLEAVEGVLGAGVYEQLRSLVRKSLAVAEDTAEGRRFRLLEAIRSFAMEQAPEDRERGAERHAMWYASQVAAASEALLGPEQSVWMRRLSADYDNIRAALMWCKESAPATFARMCYGLGRYWRRQGMLREGRSWLERATRADIDSDPVTNARLVNMLGVFCWSLGDFDGAEKRLQEAFNRFVELGETSEAAAARTNQGILAADRDQGEAAVDYQAEGVALYEKVGDVAGAARARLNLGVGLMRIDRFDDAARVLTDAMAVLEAERDYARLANLKLDLAEIRAIQNDAGAAFELLCEAFDLLRDNPSSSFVGYGLIVAALTAAQAHDYVNAATLLGAAEAAFERSEEAMSKGETLDREAILSETTTALGAAEVDRLRAEGRSLGTMDAFERFRVTADIIAG